jgi:quinone-modifying oxidoreductase subunit QmoA
MVVGGGISGLTTALEAAEVGYEVFLVEKNPYLGGRVAQLNQYFPKLCPPTCGLEINFRRIKDNPRSRFLTLAEVKRSTVGPAIMTSASRSTPAMSMKTAPAAATAPKPARPKCEPVPSTSAWGQSQGGLPAVRNGLSRPASSCRLKSSAPTTPRCQGGLQIRRRRSRHAAQNPGPQRGAIVWATGWEPYDATKIDNLGFGQYDNIITNMMMERWPPPTVPPRARSCVRPTTRAGKRRLCPVRRFTG